MNFGIMLAAQKEMIKDWPTIAGNTIEALKIMGMGIVAIFLVIGIIILAVTILNMVDKKAFMKKNASKEIVSTPTPALENKAEPSASPVVSASQVAPTVAVVNETEEVQREELDEPRYRKGATRNHDGKYRKDDED